MSEQDDIRAVEEVARNEIANLQTDNARLKCETKALRAEISDYQSSVHLKTAVIKDMEVKHKLMRDLLKLARPYVDEICKEVSEPKDWKLLEEISAALEGK